MNQESKALLVSFSGIDGAGKSTQIGRLHARLAAQGISVVRLAFWDHVVFLAKFRARISHKLLQGDVGVGTPEKPVRRNDKNARAWYLAWARSALYLLDVMNLHRVLTKAGQSNPQVIIFDRYIYDQLTNISRGWLGLLYVRFLLNLAPCPDIAYLLDANPDCARQRKPEYPLDFLHRYRRDYFALCAMVPQIRIIPAADLDQVGRLIAQEFNQVCAPEIRIDLAATSALSA